ncbi:MAG: T9SS type A sorting domain-containing protein, partial [Saprospiraceae bacterium]|nr:T9SS type A sorting domain-containing protein [Saprospiraceae bacterium]
SINISDACTDSALLNVYWVVDAYNDGIPDSGPQYTGTGMNTSNGYPIGTHKITYLVEDDCGNTTECSFLFKILDCKSPTAICKNGLSVSLMASGEVTLNANYFDGGVSDNCSPVGDLVIAYSGDPADSLRTFNCDDIGIVSVSMWVFDAAGNASNCQTFIDVQDNMGACTSNKGTVSGSIKDPSGSSVSNVTVQINGSGSAQQTTGNDGTFTFDNLDTGEDYTVAPFRNDDPRNGVSTIDIVLVTKHILNVQKLDDPYKIIAADVNHNNSVTTLDLVAMRKLILHVSNDFPNNTSWRFVEKNFAFPDRDNPFKTAFPEVFNINDLTNTEVKADFVAIKVGDVTGDAFPNNSLSVGNRAFEETTYLHTYNKEVRKGDLVSIAFYSDKNESLMGCQFTLDFDAHALTMVDLKTGSWLTHENFGLVRVNEGLITFSWNQQSDEAEIGTKAWFTLQFEAKENGKISDWLNLSSQLTRSEAYDQQGNSMNLELTFNDGTLGNEGYSLYQNKPNPFSEGTVVGFNLPENATVNLTIFDVNGKMLKTMSGQFEKGYGEFSISSNDLSNGVMYYRLDAPGFTDTKKMIMVDSKP